MQRTDLTQAAIVSGLSELGVRPGNRLVVHSSLSSFGHVAGGAATVIDALMEVVTPDGTLLMPSFNHDEPFRPGGPGLYDPAVTPTINGAIPEQFWRRPNVFRSLNPTHPFAAWGREAHRYVALHHRTLTMGPDSPLGLLMQDDGLCLLLGVGFGSNTFHHVVEMSTGAPCLGKRTESYPVRLGDGTIVDGRTWGWRSAPCPFTDQRRYVAEMKTPERSSRGRIGGCEAILFRLQDCFDVVARLLLHGAEEFPPCHGCAVRPRQVAQTVPSDWDDEKGTLGEDSAAWHY